MLENNGFDVTYLNVDENGLISLSELKNSIRKNERIKILCWFCSGF